jgi:membrane-associated progesterone receptor component
VFDVSRKRETYGPGGSYALFAGKDASRALGLSSLKPEDAVPDWSTLEEKDRKTLDDWHSFFTCVFTPLSLRNVNNLLVSRKRYAVVGRVADLPAAVANR